MLLHAPKPDSRLHVADKISDCANGSSPIELDELYVYHFLRCEHGFLVAYFFFDINYRTNSSQMRRRYVSHLCFYSMPWFTVSCRAADKQVDRPYTNWCVGPFIYSDETRADGVVDPATNAYCYFQAV